jgi:hypothetical protein
MLGQAMAFRGAADDSRHAEAAFRSALGLFTEPRDLEREWVYLGHLACDRGAVGRPLWDEVTRVLPELDFRRPVRRATGQYVLALQLKGLLCYGTKGELERYLAAWSADGPLLEHDLEARAKHPFGLIEQTLGLCRARNWRETGIDAQRRQALVHFEAARAHMNQGGSLLKMLALACLLRQRLFEAETGPREAAGPSRLFAACRQFEASLLEHFGERAWGRDQQGRLTGHFGSRDPGDQAPSADRARGLLSAVRFNYW